MQKLLIGLVRAYRYLISPLLGNNCRYFPSCSEYAEEAVREYGVVHGGWLAIKRISRCHPWHPGGVDPVPLRSSSRPGGTCSECDGSDHPGPASAAQEVRRSESVQPQEQKQEQRLEAARIEPSMPVRRPPNPTIPGPIIPRPVHSGLRSGSSAGPPKKD